MDRQLACSVNNNDCSREDRSHTWHNTTSHQSVVVPTVSPVHKTRLYGQTRSTTRRFAKQTPYACGSAVFKLEPAESAAASLESPFLCYATGCRSCTLYKNHS